MSITLAFGGKPWSINPHDFNLGPVSNVNGGSSRCIGGIFDLTAGNTIPVQPGKPGWVIGHTFLKSVYSVYRAIPPSVGFAALSPLASGNDP